MIMRPLADNHDRIRSRDEWMGKGEETGRFKEGEEKGRWERYSVGR